MLPEKYKKDIGGPDGPNRPRRKHLADRSVSGSTLDRARLAKKKLTWIKAEIIRLELDAAASKERPELCPISFHNMGAVVRWVSRRRRR